MRDCSLHTYFIILYVHQRYHVCPILNVTFPLSSPNVVCVTGDGGGECADVLTCGVCQKDFLLADILRFIQHKVHNCQAPTAPCGQEAPSGEQDAAATAPPNARDHNGDLGSEGPSNPASPATVKEEGDDGKADDKRKRDDEDDAPARKKPRSTQDAEANTTDSGEYSGGCHGSRGVLKGPFTDIFIFRR